MVLHISADSRYILYVNGAYVGRGPARCYPEWQSFDSYEISHLLHPGTNCIAVHGYYQGEHNSDYILGVAGIIAQLESCDNGVPAVISDTGWRVLHTGEWSGERLRKTWHDFVEIRDARKGVGNWTAPEYDDRDWRRATLVPETPESYPRIPSAKDLTPRDIPFLAHETIYPQRVIETGECESFGIVDDVLQQLNEDMYEAHTDTAVEGARNICTEDAAPARIIPVEEKEAAGKGLRDVYCIIDFGREVVGYPVIRVNAGAGTYIDCAYSERLIGGKVPPHLHVIAYVDRYICTDGLQEWEQCTWKGFRYLHMVFRTIRKPVEVLSVSVNFTTYPVTWRGSFNSSDPLLNQIWHMGAYTTQLCMHDAYMDCPWREKAQWVGDARVETLVNYVAFGDRLLAARLSRQVAQSQSPLGITGQVAPFAGGNSRTSHENETHESFGGISDFCLHWVCSVEEYLLYTGDRETVRELYPRLVKALSWFEHFENGDGLLENLPGWRFIDWARVDKDGISMAYNGLYLTALEKTARMAELLGEQRDATRFEDRAARTRAAARSLLYDDTGALFADNVVNGVKGVNRSMHANALAILAGVAGPGESPRIIEALFDERTNAAVTSPFFSHFLLEALHRAGCVDRALGFIRKQWKIFVDAGSTTTWERWSVSTRRNDDNDQHCNPALPRDALVADASSMAHAWGASPTWFLLSCVVGIRPVAPGFAEYVIEPQLDLLESVDAVMPTPMGEIKVGWSRRSGGVDVQIDSPEELRGTLNIPKCCAGNQITVNGKVCSERTMHLPGGQ